MIRVAIMLITALVLVIGYYFGVDPKGHYRILLRSGENSPQTEKQSEDCK